MNKLMAISYMCSDKDMSIINKNGRTIEDISILVTKTLTIRIALQ